MLMNNYIDEISTKKSRLKRSVRATEEFFPLMIIDKSKNKMVGIFDNERDLKKKFDSYKAEHPNSDVRAIDKKYRDYTTYIEHIPEWSPESAAWIKW